MKKTINIGVIGLGNGGGNHVQSVSGYRRARVVAVSDIDGKLLRQTVRKHAVPHAYGDWQQLIEDPDVEAVILATPPGFRQEMFLAAAKAGKQILAEKPFGVDLSQARRMAKAAAKHGVRVMVNFGTRNLPTYRKLRSLLQSGKYGKPQWIWFKYYLPANPKVFIPPAWFWRKALSGGHLLENAGHAFDLICDIMGPVRHVTGTTAQLPLKHFAETLKKGAPDIENVGVAVLKHASGGITVLGNGCNPAGEWGMTFDIITDTCVVTVSGDRFIEIMRDGKRIYRHESPVGWNPIPYGAQAFIRYLDGGAVAGDSFATPRDGVRAMQIAQAAYDSAASGKTVVLKELESLL